MVNKTISLEHDIWYKLKSEDNASSLINKLLIDYYKNKESKPSNLTPEQIKELKEKNELYKQLGKELKEALNG